MVLGAVFARLALRVSRLWRCSLACGLRDESASFSSLFFLEGLRCVCFVRVMLVVDVFVLEARGF